MTPPGSTTENITTNYDKVQCLLPDSKPYVLFGFIIILIVLMALKFWRYLNSSKFMLEKLLELAVCIMALPLSAFCHFLSGHVQWTILVVINFVAWINLLNYIRKLPRLGVYVLMVWSTIATFLRFSPIFVLFLLPFSVTFHVLLGDSPGFINLLRRILQTIVFLTGEFNYEENIASSQYTLTYIMFFMYLLVGTVFLMNLLVGLAVSDTNDAMEEATKTRI
uniref:Ion transport domain-containing protein n=1 Tax=Acrobeloides nanus TaxID=290746 RepID=A0A914DH02_9BILA